MEALVSGLPLGLVRALQCPSQSQKGRLMDRLMIIGGAMFIVDDGSGPPPPKPKWTIRCKLFGHKWIWPLTPKGNPPATCLRCQAEGPTFVDRHKR